MNNRLCLSMPLNVAQGAGIRHGRKAPWPTLAWTYPTPTRAGKRWSRRKVMRCGRMIPRKGVYTPNPGTESPVFPHYTIVTTLLLTLNGNWRGRAATLRGDGVLRTTVRGLTTASSLWVRGGQSPPLIPEINKDSGAQ